MLQTIPIHSAPITSAAFVSTNAGPNDETRIVATSSHDLTAKLTQFSLSDPEYAQTIASLHLHTGPLTSIAANAVGSHLLTSSQDGLIGLWDTSIPDTDEVSLDTATNGPERKKRRKLESAGEPQPRRKAPAAVLKSHTARVSKAIFTRDGRTAVSAGFDSTIRTWDVESSVCTNTVVRDENSFLIMTTYLMSDCRMPPQKRF